MNAPSHPFPRSWWIEPGVLLGSCFPGGCDASERRRNLGALLDVGVRSILCLQPEDESMLDGSPFPSYETAWRELAADRGLNVRWARHPIVDMSVTTPARMNAILDAIDDEGHATLVHCWGGHGRTGIVAGCWLVRHGASAEGALARIEAARRHDPRLAAAASPQTPDQVELIRSWPRHDRALT